MNNTELIAQINALLSIDAVGALVPHGLGGHAKTLLKAAADALEAAQPPGEPVAYVNSEGFIIEMGMLLSTGTKLYTHPEPQVPMTDAQLDQLVFDCGLSASALDIASAIEAHYKIGVIKP